MSREMQAPGRFIRKSIESPRQLATERGMALDSTHNVNDGLHVRPYP
jgi:hypothetical protein